MRADGIATLLEDLEEGMTVKQLLDVFRITDELREHELLCGFLNGINSFCRMIQHNPRYNCHRFNGLHVDFEGETNCELCEDYYVQRFTITGNKHNTVIGDETIYIVLCSGDYVPLRLSNIITLC